MSFAIALLLKLLIVSLVNCELDSRIWYGQDVGAQEFNWLVKVHVNLPGEELICSGSILNQYWVITAAHCVHNQMQDTRIINHKQQILSTPLTVIQAFRNPQASSNTELIQLPLTKYDLALLKTMQPITFGQPVPLARVPPSQGQVASIAGYGFTENSMLPLPRGTRMTLTYCAAGYANDLLCSYFTDHSPKTGSGDSGGPVVVDGYLVGVVSGNFGNNDYFANIYQNLAWIEQTMASH